MVNEQGVAPEAVAAAQENSVNLLDTIKGWLRPEFLTKKFHEWKPQLLDWGIYLGAGIVAGFLIKRYLKYIVLLALFVAGFIMLEQFDLLSFTIHWEKVQDLLGIKTVPKSFDAQVLQSYWQWVAANLGIVLSASIGFFIGLRLG